MHGLKLGGLIVGLAILLSGCNAPTARDMYGKGPVPNRAVVEAVFKRYLEQVKGSPGYFFVSEDGRAFGGSYCPGVECFGNEMQLAEHQCLRSSNGKPCWIYARAHVVVWDEAATGTPRDAAPMRLSQQLPTDLHVPPKVVNASGAEFVPIVVKWEGFKNLVLGTIEIHGGSGATLTMTAPDGSGTCSGGYFGKSSGRWSVVCPNDQYGAGTLNVSQAGRGTTGHGKDGLGRTIEFEVVDN